MIPIRVGLDMFCRGGSQRTDVRMPSRSRREQEPHTLVGVVQHSSGRILDGYYEGDIGKEHGCMSRSSKTLLIRHCSEFSGKFWVLALATCHLLILAAGRLKTQAHDQVFCSQSIYRHSFGFSSSTKSQSATAAARTLPNCTTFLVPHPYRCPSAAFSLKK